MTAVLIAAKAGTRADALAGVIARLAGAVQRPEFLRAQTATPCALEPTAAGRLAALRDSGRITVIDGDDGRSIVRFDASPFAKAELAARGSHGRWPARVGKMISEAAPVGGATFRFDVGGHALVEAFITDWSPFPAACALAVHPSHPLADATGNRADTFTGFHARHPLTGDLMAVWTAAWVRPGFGTGSVIVNPAHSEADLAFARSVGLPVRFALVLEPPAPEVWPQPPIIRSGVAQATGLIDGTPWADAARSYLARLLETGAAAEVSDRQVPGLELGHLEPGENLADAFAAGSERDWSPAALALLADEPPALAGAVVASDQLHLLNGLRALSFELGGEDLLAARCAVVSPDNDADAHDAVIQLASLCLGRLDQPVVLKEPQVEQAKRFLDLDEELRLRPVPAADLSNKPPKRTPPIMSKLRDLDLSGAFAELYKLQRDIRKDAQVSAADQVAYFFAASILIDRPPPDGYPTSEVEAALGVG
jgi:leucyl-tRNA synthetase